MQGIVHSELIYNGVSMFRITKREEDVAFTFVHLKHYRYCIYI